MFRALWLRLMLGLARRRRRPVNLNALYAVENPWAMTGEGEVYRFAETNKLILAEFGHVGRLLEIGCGEAHQSLYLQKTCDRLTGLDASERAVTRARTRCPDATFVVGDLTGVARLAPGPYDLIVACEVLYYLDDIAAALRGMRALGPNFLASCYHDQYREVAAAVLAVFPGALEITIRFGDTTWHFFVARAA